MSYDVLVKNALKVRSSAYAPYSKFKVGACLRTKDGKIFNGCNVENASYSMTMCAERTAMFKAVSEGYTEFTDICIVGGYNKDISEFCYPCGACVQVMTEFCNPDCKVILFNGKDINVTTLKDLFPYTFTNVT